MSSRRLHLDFETKSVVDVVKSGGYAYSRHPSTDIHCLTYKLGTDKPVLVTQAEMLSVDGCPKLEKLYDYARDPDILFVAHNAFFEQCMWRNVLVPRYGAPDLPVRRWRCTAAKAAYMSLPRMLAGVGTALNLPIQKDSSARSVMLKLAKPRRGKNEDRDIFWQYEDCPQDFETLYAYNITDVETETLVDNALADLNKREQEVWFLDQEINFRGLQLDLAAVHQVLKCIDTTMQRMTDEFRDLTQFEVDNPTQVFKFREWLITQGVELPNLQAATVDKALGDENLSPAVRRTLEIRRALSKVSTAKYQAMLDRVGSDGRLRDILLYCAAITNRWGGRGVQPHNLPRGTVNSDTALTHIMLDDYEWLAGLYPDLMSVYSSCVRGMFISSPGCRLIVGDFSAIEAMTLPWLAGQTRTLDIFRRNEDIYCLAASTTFNFDVTPANKYERSVGKVEILALGYHGGIGAFGTMCRALSVSLLPAYEVIWPDSSVEEQEKAAYSYEFYLKRLAKTKDPDPISPEEGLVADIIKQRWRADNPEIVRYWHEIETAAMRAIITGEKQFVGGASKPFSSKQPTIVYGTMRVCPEDCIDEAHAIGHNQHLICRLPSGNCIVYPFVKLSDIEDDEGTVQRTISYMSQDSVTFQFKRTYTYSGKLVENITQAVARDILADALLRVDAAGYPIVLHVHDEIVTDVPNGFGSVAEFEALMSQVPPWAEGLPVKVEAWEGERYRK